MKSFIYGCKLGNILHKLNKWKVVETELTNANERERLHHNIFICVMKRLI